MMASLPFITWFLRIGRSEHTLILVNYIKEKDAYKIVQEKITCNDGKYLFRGESFNTLSLLLIKSGFVIQNELTQTYLEWWTDKLYFQGSFSDRIELFKNLTGNFAVFQTPHNPFKYVIVYNENNNNKELKDIYIIRNQEGKFYLKQDDIKSYPDNEKILQEYNSLKDVVENVVKFLKLEFLNYKNHEKMYLKVENDYIKRRISNMRTNTPYRGRNSQKRTWTYYDETQLQALSHHESSSREKLTRPKSTLKAMSPRATRSVKLDVEDIGIPSSPRKQESQRGTPPNYEPRKSISNGMSNTLPNISLRDDYVLTKHNTTPGNSGRLGKNMLLSTAESRNFCTENTSISSDYSAENNDPTLNEILKSIQRLEHNQNKIMDILSKQIEKVDLLYSIIVNKGGAETGDGMEQNGEDKGGEKGSQTLWTKSQRKRMLRLNLDKGPGGAQEEEKI